MKAALLVGFGSVAVFAVVVVVATLLSGRNAGKTLSERELSWVAHYSRWLDQEGCGGLHAASTDRLRRVESAARAACRGDGRWRAAEHALDALLVSHRPLPRRRAVDAESHIDPVLGRVAAKIAERKVEARCWSDDDWYHVNIERRAVTGETDVWAVGIAEPGIVHLDGQSVCEPLARFYYERYTPAQNNERSLLATALAVLAHEAEHNYNFKNSEAEVECFAVQDVRDMVTRAGRSDEFAADIAAYAWDVSYIRGDPIYSTGRCRNGGPLDLYPKSDLWP